MKKWLYFLFFIPFSLFANQYSLILKNAPTPQILTYLAGESETNIVLNQDVDSFTTLRLENSSLETILKSITKINKLDLSKEGNIYYVNEKKEENRVDIPQPPVKTA